MIERRLRNIVISGFGSKVSRENELVKIITQEGEQIHVSPREVEQVIIAGESSITSGVVRLLLKNGVDLVFIEHGPTNFFARVVRSDYNMITELWRKQILMKEDRRMEIAKEIMDCAVYNKLRILQSLAKNRGVDFNREIEYLNRRRAVLGSIKSNEALMGVEGDATKTYFAALRKIIPEEFGFDKRERHPPHDPTNSMLSYGYTVLKSRVEYGLMRAGLNPYEGILHAAYRNRPALSFDLIEEFRQPIVDRVVITQMTQKQVREEEFEKREDMCYMSEGVRGRFLDALYHRFEDVYTFRGERIEFLDIIFEQAKLLAKAIGNNEGYEGFRYR
jgi:CRISPR-associated protein Cas1